MSEKFVAANVIESRRVAFHLVDNLKVRLHLMLILGSTELLRYFNDRFLGGFCVQERFVIFEMSFELGD